MKKNSIKNLTKVLSFLFLILVNFNINAQQTLDQKPKSEFWKKVQIGGGLGVGIGTGTTNISIAPTAIYNFNQYVSAGLGVQYNNFKQKDLFSSNMYGGSVVGLFNPIKEAQLSVELEQLRVSVSSVGVSNSQKFWNTGLFVGAGYRMENVTAGVRYNVLFNKDKNVYGDALMPFVRVYF